MVKHAADELGNTVNYLSHRLGLRWSLVLTPWRLAWRWLSLYLSFLLELCAIAGAAPSGYMTKNQVHVAADALAQCLLLVTYSFIANHVVTLCHPDVCFRIQYFLEEMLCIHLL